MKEDVEVPRHPPRKRRQLEAADPRHLAIWANDESLPDHERNRAQYERERRKQAAPRRVVGVLVGLGGATPPQVAALDVALRSKLPTEVQHPYCQPNIHTVCRATGAKVVALRGDLAAASWAVVDASDEVIGLVSDSTMPTVKLGLWKALRYAKDRGVDVTIIWPTGLKLEGRW